jgi:hypothetical protein
MQQDFGERAFASNSKGAEKVSGISAFWRDGFEMWMLGLI